MVPVKPQATGEVRVTFDAMQLGSYDKIIDVFVGGQSKPIQVRMKGKVVAQPQGEHAEPGDEASADVGDDFAVFAVQPRIMASPETLRMTTVERDKVKAEVTIWNGGRGVLRIHEVCSLHPAIKVKLPKKTLVAGERVKMKVQLARPMSSARRVSPDISIHSNDPLHPVTVIHVE